MTTPVSDCASLLPAPLIGVLAVVGVGLIGGSFAAALRERGAVGRILGAGRHARTLDRACERGLIDAVVTLQEAAAQADLVLLATPVGAIEGILETMKPHLRAHTVITDAGSTKASVVRSARAALGPGVARFVPGHPIAGREQTGPEAADAGLYRNRTVVLTPLVENSAADQRYVSRAWEQCGAQVITMDATAHDVALASISHVPHLLSSIFMEHVAMSDDCQARLHLAGSGFRDFTRIAAGSPEMWRDIFVTNHGAVAAELRHVRTAIEQAEQLLLDEDWHGLYGLLERAALARRAWGSGRSESP